MTIKQAAEPSIAVAEWIEAAPPEAKRFMGGVIFTNFLHERRNVAFQMQGQFDGAMEEVVKGLFENEYEFLVAVIAALEPT